MSTVQEILGEIYPEDDDHQQFQAVVEIDWDDIASAILPGQVGSFEINQVRWDFEKEQAIIELGTLVDYK
jgi:hypothetical protein